MARNIEGASFGCTCSHNAFAIDFCPGPCIGKLENQVQFSIIGSLVGRFECKCRSLAQVPSFLVFDLGVVTAVGHRHLAVAAFLANRDILDLDASFFSSGERLHRIECGVDGISVSTKVRFGLVANVLPSERASVTSVKCLAVAFFGRNLSFCSHARSISITLPAAGREFTDNHRLIVVLVCGRHLSCGIYERRHRIILVVRIVMRLEEVECSIRLATGSDKFRVIPPRLILDIHATRRHKEFRIYRVDCRGNLVREFLEHGLVKFLGCPTHACHAFGFVKDFPSHECIVIADCLYHRIEHVFDKGLGALIFEQVFVRGDVELFAIEAPLVRFHQVVAEKAHGNHHAVFFSNIQSLLHVGDGVFLEARHQMRCLVNFRALAHVVKKPPANGIAACGTRAFDSLTPGVFVQRSITHIGVVIAPSEVCAREENLLAVIHEVSAAYSKARGSESRNGATK